MRRRRLSWQRVSGTLLAREQLNESSLHYVVNGDASPFSERFHAGPQVVSAVKLAQRFPHRPLLHPGSSLIGEGQPRQSDIGILVRSVGGGQEAGQIVITSSNLSHTLGPLSETLRHLMALRYSRGMAMTRAWPLLLAIFLAFWAPRALAAPGEAQQMSGLEPHGPATRAPTAIHQNPAMLGAMEGLSLQVSGHVGLRYDRVRRYQIDATSGEPTNDLADPVAAVNPDLGFFAGATFYFEPLAVAVAYYDLSGSYLLRSPTSLRYHLAPDPDPNCLNPSRNKCPPLGGSVSARQELSLALALNRGRWQLGLAVHLPRHRERFGFDNDTELQFIPENVSTAQCDAKEDPLCAERIGFKGWTQWIPRDGAPSGFDAALTVGISAEFYHQRLTLGARYRTVPLARLGRAELGGVGLVCRPETGSAIDQVDVVPYCERAGTVEATLSIPVPQEFSLGGSILLGANRDWRMTLNLHWLDLCPGGWKAGECDNRDAHELSLIGLNRNAVVPPTLVRYRGSQDLYQLDAFLSHRLRTNLSILASGQVSSPTVKRSAQTAAYGEGWRVALGVGTRVRLPRTKLLISPGYRVNIDLPRNVQPSLAGYDPAGAVAFTESGGDLNGSGAQAVLEGRGRSTNAGRYFSTVHTISLTLGWADRDEVLD